MKRSLRPDQPPKRATRALVAWAAACLAICGAGPAFASCQLIDDPGSAGGRLLQCGASVSAHLAKGAVLREVEGGAALRLDSGAALIEFRPQTGGEGFQILTPEAVAAVRGTTWAVEVVRGKTSVLVVDGHVSVRARNRGASVLLAPGEGVDVDRSASRLEPKPWPELRVRRLLALFGR